MDEVVEGATAVAEEVGEVEDTRVVHLVSSEDSRKTACGEDIVTGMRITDAKGDAEGDVTCDAEGCA